MRWDVFHEDLSAFQRWSFNDRAWGKGNNPGTAVKDFLKENSDFEIDNLDTKLVFTGSPGGYLRRVKWNH